MQFISMNVVEVSAVAVGPSGKDYSCGFKIAWPTRAPVTSAQVQNAIDNATHEMHRLHPNNPRVQGKRESQVLVKPPRNPRGNYTNERV